MIRVSLRMRCSSIRSECNGTETGSGSTPIGGALGVGLVGAGLGLGIGVGMDALIQGRTLIYYR
jgi:hypothetical protein